MVAAPKAKSSSVSILDKYTIQEKIVPLLRAIKTKEPAVMVRSREGTSYRRHANYCTDGRTGCLQGHQHPS
jgi:hypothetical protein